MVKRGIPAKSILITVISVLLLSLFAFGTSQASAASSIIVIGPGSAKDVGPNFTTTKTVSRNDLIKFSKEIKRLEKDANLLNNIRFSLASSLVTGLLTKKLSYSTGASGASAILGSLVIDKNLGSKKIDNALKKSTAKKFKVKIKYVRNTMRGQDKWYEASSVSVKPA